MSVMIYLTTWVTVENLIHMLQTSSFNQTQSSSCFKQYFPFPLGGENIHNYFNKSIASSHHFIKSIASSRCFIKSITSSSCVENTPGDTLVHTLVHKINTRPLVWCLKNSDRKVKEFCVIPRTALSRLVYCSSMQYPQYIRMCLVLQRDSRFVSRNCHATDIALAERLGSNGFYHLQ